MEKLTVSVAIPTRNRLESFKECMLSVLDQTLLPEEIIIVDQSDERSIEKWLSVSNVPGEVRVVYVHSLVPGLPRARNAAIDLCRSNILVAMDDDMNLDQHFLAEVVGMFERDALGTIGAVCGETMNDIQDKPMAFGFLAEVFLRFFQLFRYGNGKFLASGAITLIKPCTTNEVRDVECSAGPFSYRTSVARKYRPDITLERLSPYAWGEDDDVCYRVSREYRIVYNPMAKVLHRAGKRSYSSLYSQQRVENSYYLFKKNLPQTLKHRSAFWLSITGTLLFGIGVVIAKRDARVLRGSFKGLVNILRRTDR